MKVNLIILTMIIIFQFKTKRDLVYEKYKNINWEKLNIFDPNCWLSHTLETGQTLDEYKELIEKKFENKKGKQKIIIQPLSNMRNEILIELKSYLEIFFNQPVFINKKIEIPKNLFNKEKKAYPANSILEFLYRNFHRSNIAVLGIIDKDIFLPNMSELYGAGSRELATSVISISKFGTPFNNNKILLNRILKTATHELCHTFGIKHCIFYRCVMNVAEDLNQLDSLPLSLCPLCEDKVCWLFNIDKRKRRKNLINFYFNHNLLNEIDRLIQLGSPVNYQKTRDNY